MHTHCQRHGLGHVFREVIQPEPFNRFRFRRYARELSKAVAEMGDYGARFTPTPHTRVIPQRQIMSEPTPMPAVDIAPNTVEGPIGNVTGIQAGLFEAKMAELKKKLADRINTGLGRIDTAGELGAAKMDAAVDSIVAKVDKEIEDKLHEFAQFSNGGPA